MTAFVIYLVLAAVGLVTAWWFNGVAVYKNQDYLGSWFGSEVDWVLSCDLLIVAIAGAAFMVLEGRRLGMKNLWMYLVGAGFTAMAFVFPLFLAMRSRKLAAEKKRGGRIEQFKLGHYRVDVLVPTDLAPESPLLVMHDGKNLLIDRKLTWNGQNWGLPEMIAAGRVIPGRLGGGRLPLIAGVYRKDDREEIRINELGPQRIVEQHPEVWDTLPPELMPPTREVLGNEYQKFLAEELVPELVRRFGLKFDRERTAIAGSSMGGLASLEGISAYPQVYGTALAISTHWPFGFDIPVKVMAAALPKPGSHRIWTDCGTMDVDEPYQPYQEQFIELMEAKGYRRDHDFMATVYAGTGHNENWWAGRFHLALNWWLNPRS